MDLIKDLVAHRLSLDPLPAEYHSDGRCDESAAARVEAATTVTCAICLEGLDRNQTLYTCCVNAICTACSKRCEKAGLDTRCPLCRTPSPKSLEESFGRIEAHAARGNAVAQFVLATCYRDGHLVPKSAERAVELFGLAAHKGHAEAQLHYGQVFYEGGAGGEEANNHAVAARWFKLAADQGDSQAQYNLGAMILRGEGGCVQSVRDAMRWYELAAKQGLVSAQYELAYATQIGLGVPKDEHKALRLLKTAAANGSVEAQAAVATIEEPVAAAGPPPPPRQRESKQPAVHDM